MTGLGVIDPEVLRRRELGAFLRSRRERVAPEQVGMPAAGRRRTPGLRREELAQLAGVGVTWYTWLEQGRSINPSEQVLDAIARTLQLDRHEREHLLALAGHTTDTAPPEIDSIPAGVRALLDRLSPHPACVVGARFDILAYNATYGAMIEDLDTIPVEDRNMLWLAFTHPAWRTALVDWDNAAAHMTATLRASMADHVGEPAWKSLVRRLRAASPDFAGMWDTHDVGAPENRTKVLLSPRFGLLRFDYTNLWFGPRRGARLVIYAPADAATAAALEDIASSRTPLRAVPSQRA
jgi:transcriptional regulator with XRE-family HTH domain